MNGVNVLDLSAKPFTHYRSIEGDSQSLSNNIINVVYEDRSGMLWFGGHGGLTQYDRRRGQFTHYTNDANDPDSLNHNFVKSMCEDRDGNFWIGTAGGGLNKLDRSTNTFTHYVHDPKNPESLSNNLIFDIECQGDSGFIWLATWGGGINRFDAKTETFSHYKADSQDETGLLTNKVFTVHEDRSGYLWVGTTLGLNRLDLETEEFRRYYDRAADPDVLGVKLGGATLIESLYEDEEGQMWVGGSAGLGQYDPAREQFQHYGAENSGLPHNASIRGILRADPLPGQTQGDLWLSLVSQGLVRFNPQTGEARQYTEQDGLQGNAFLSHMASYKSRSGELFFSGANGVTAFDPSQIHDNPQVPTVVITDFQLDRKPVEIGEIIEPSPENQDGHSNFAQSPILEQSIVLTRSLSLSYAYQSLDFEFAALNYQSPEQNRYRYQLEGFDYTWTEVGQTQASATYTNLDPGKYIFRVLGSNNDGLWNETGAAIAITVLPPWWATRWFRGLSGLVVVGAIVGGVRWRTYVTEQRNRILEQVVRERTVELAIAKEKAEVASQAKSQFLSQMSHELRTPLNAILGYAQILKRRQDLDSPQRKGLNIIHNSARHLLSLINDILDLAKIEAGRMDLHPTEVNLPHFLEGVAEIIRLSADQKGLVFQCQLDPVLPQAVMVDVTRLRAVLLNLLGNAVKFTTQGQVTFQVSRQQEGDQDLGTAQDSGQASGSSQIAEPISDQNPPSIARIRFDVIDSGVGIAATDLAAIFQPFEQAPTPQQSEGTGLGLTITQQWIQRMGGQVQVSSEVGQGSHFWFELALPLCDVQRTIEPWKQSIPIGYEGRRRTLLVADDNLENRLVLLELLRPLGFEVVLCANGQECLDKVRFTAPDLILLDFLMPGMSGMQVIQSLRQDPTSCDLPVIVISSSLPNIGELEGQPIDCQGFCLKPIQIDQLLAILTTCLNLRWTFRPETTNLDAPAPLDSVFPQIFHYSSLFDRSQDADPPSAIPKLPAGVADDRARKLQPLGGSHAVSLMGSDDALVLPPASDLAHLHYLARLGDLEKVRVAIDELESENPTYKAFTQRIRHYADCLEDEPILTLLTQHLAAQHWFQPGRAAKSPAEVQSPRITATADSMGQAGEALAEQTAMILLVDDIQINLQVLIDTLKPEGFTLISARNGESGLQRAIFSQPDLILLDVMMPGIDGFETCRRLKAEPATQQIPVLFMTALGDEESKVRGFEVGAVDYITKPIAEQEVLARVRTHLRLQRQQRLLEQRANCDPLTGIANRRQFDSLLEQEWARALRESTPLALMMVDVDHFKLFNDHYGHPAGDECLKRVAQTLRQTVQTQGRLSAIEGRGDRSVVARYGGEEFAVILPDTPLDIALSVAEKICRDLEALQLPHAASLTSQWVTLSLGVVSIVPTSRLSRADLLEQADQALYQAKKQGRNRCGTLDFVPHSKS